MAKRMFFHCELCGKKLIERTPRGLWHFIFGKSPDRDSKPPVDMLIHGSVKMRCLRSSCRQEHPEHWNILTFFPPQSRVAKKSIGTAETSDNLDDKK
jgi:hypothetical protein